MRKTPLQQRSRVTVDTIVEAATRVLARRGWARFTTNEIAEVAGVSVGSLYQYFPNKLALAEAIRQRHLDEVLVALAGPGEEEPVTLERRVARFVDGVVAAHSIDQVLHRVLVDEVPLAPRSTYPEFEAEYRRRYRALVTESAGPKPDADADGDTAARMLSSAVEGAVHAAARRGDLAAPAMRSELVRLVLAYLRDRRQSRE
ncbi:MULTISPECIES: TetR/AcrR family transcriptional regulator [unclassified Variovorax]|uniref:TetR/AcrR family transcriptional regulator n=1 Tax=unclassified Variovorax TaxID=663243 RepID=UPI003F466EAF